MHLHLQFGESDTSDGYHVCNKCHEKTMLISAPMCWSIDSEPFKADEVVETEEGDCVEISAEVTGHFCPECRSVTSVAINQREAQ